MEGKSDKTLTPELADARKQIELLKQSEQKYRQIVENANSIILLMDKKGNITFLNQFAQRFFGFYEKDIVGKNVIGTIVSEKDFSGRDLIRMISDIEENPERHSVNENENMRSNGERVRILWTNKAIIDDNGDIREILCIGNRVTAEYKANE
jgi:PAS domain S-box-containing protein